MDIIQEATHPRPKPEAPAAKLDRPITVEAPSDGPSLGPAIPDPDTESVVEGSGSIPMSPYSATRAAIRNLTMPPVPNFDIPDSPPGSPPLKATKKFDNFLDWKKQGVHFNQKLESSSALANPTLFQKLMDFAGLDEQSQYATTLSDDVTVPTKFPEWAYADQLNRQQDELRKKKDEERRGQPRQFVSGERLHSASSSRGPTPGGSSRGQRYLSTAERVMQGLDRERSSPASSSGSRR